MAGVCGAAAGVLGLTGVSGFVFYLVVALLSSALLLAKAGTKTDTYFKSCYDLLGGIFGVLDVTFTLLSFFSPL